MSNKVDCPICGIAVVEEDINFHLDLRCKGVTEEWSTPRKGSVNEPRSQLRPSKEQTEVVALVRAEGKSSARSREKNVAPIFGSASGLTQGMKRKSEAKELEPVLEFTDKKAKQHKMNSLEAAQPLAERSRPTDISQYVGQANIVGLGSLLRTQIESGKLVGSCILWGPPGCGKTTLARLIAKSSGAEYKELSATSSGAQDMRQIFEKAKNTLIMTNKRTVLLIDELHRFNRAQQDILLPYVEKGWIQLIGATTENPSFKVNGALLSRCQVFTLQSHSPESLRHILQNVITNMIDANYLPYLPPELVPFLADVADGDARQALNGLELALKTCQAMDETEQSTAEGNRRDQSGAEREADVLIERAENEAQQSSRDKAIMDAVKKGLQKGYNRTGEERYDMISALHKCLRGSDGSAAMYWLARMITGGEDALYIARRLIVVASEDVGLADNHALPLAVATYQACQTVGLPECRINLAHCVAYLAEAPKSTRSYVAYKTAEELAKEPPLPPVPLQIRNAPTKLMKSLGYGQEYIYNPDYRHPVYNEYLPKNLLQRSSLTSNPEQHILQTPDEYEKSKRWDAHLLEGWETKVNGGSHFPTSMT
nr:ATPase [Cryptococcus depauperatus CBS 7855]